MAPARRCARHGRCAGQRLRYLGRSPFCRGGSGARGGQLDGIGTRRGYADLLDVSLLTVDVSEAAMPAR